MGYHGHHSTSGTTKHHQVTGKRQAMDTKDPSHPNNDQIVGLNERIARMETKMDFVATHKDLAAVRTGIVDLRAEVLKEIGGVKTLIANREASMQRWLLGVTATTLVGVITALVGVTTTLVRTIA